MNQYEPIFAAVTRDERYLANLDWGQPRGRQTPGAGRPQKDQLGPKKTRRPRRLADDGGW
jgi:hypothetical protein